jgi:hypothetical protein
VIAPIKKRLAQNLPLYELKITLRGSKPAIWRRVQVPGSINLNRLHDVFQVVMGWTDSHLHQFVDAPIVYSVPLGDDYPGEERLDERRFRLADVARHEKASFMETRKKRGLTTAPTSDLDLLWSSQTLPSKFGLSRMGCTTFAARRQESASFSVSFPRQRAVSL